MIPFHLFTMKLSIRYTNFIITGLNEQKETQSLKNLLGLTKAIVDSGHLKEIEA